MIVGPATDMSAPESGSTWAVVGPLQVDISALMVSAGWIPAWAVLIEGVTYTAFMAGFWERG